MGVAPSHDDIPPQPDDPSSWEKEAQIPQNSAEILKPTLQEKNQLPHKCDEILKLAISPVDRSSVKKLYEQLYAGVYIDSGNKKYWVDRESKSNCFTLFPQGLKLNWGSLQWLPWKEPSTGETFRIPKFLQCPSIRIAGRFEMAYLSPGINYEVVFVVKLTDSAYGWEEPLEFKLAFPDGTTRVYEICLETMLRERWNMLRTVPFEASGMVGEMEASIKELKVERRGGLILKWIIVRPKSA